MRRLKFWQKTYLATLGLFLISVGCVAFLVFALGQKQGFDACVRENLSAEGFFSKSLAQDVATLNVRRPAAIPPLYDYYAARYGTDTLGIEIYESGKCVRSSLPQGAVPLGKRPELSVEPGMRKYLVRAMPVGRFIYIATALPAPLDNIITVYSASLETFYHQWETIRLLLFVVGGSVSLIFAAALWFVHSGMYKPLLNVTQTAQALAHGELSARANTNRKDEFGELAASLNGMAETVEKQISELQASRDDKQRMLDNLAHELRTPLAAISGWAETLRGANLTPHEQYEAADTILFEANRALSLSRQLLRLSVLQHENAELVPVNVAAAFARAECAVLPKAEKNGVFLTVAHPLDTLNIWADEALLESLLCNLLDNAVKACQAGGKVKLLAIINRDSVVFEISDTGRGMSSETLQNIGMPFYRADKARSRAEGGAGLGLSLCFAIASLCRATLRFESEEGHGTKAIVTFTSPTQTIDKAKTLPL
ncbi:MAG: HAMP domain-containing sensor histidine kinase [Oscillospiraceae bacterium]